MQIEIGKELFGFKVLNKEYINEIESYAYFLNHIETGSEVFAIKNKDTNKSFAIGLRTPPPNQKGVLHILEHSILQGSRKFPIRDLFSELMKGSFQTYLNAMTFADKTVYLLSSKNKKDYFNLMDVYLNSVFYPLLSQDTFKQEGWRYELDSIDENINYNGVVYNEMKNDLYSSRDILYSSVLESLFPSTIYKFSIGGHPKYIPDLTYNELIKYHQKFYHPSNSFIYYYGDIALEDELEFIQENYLKYFKKLCIDSKIKTQKPISNIITKHYPINKNENLSNNYIVGIGYVIGNMYDKELMIILEILIQILYKNSNSLLKKKFIDSNIAQDFIEFHCTRGRLQQVLIFALSNTNKKYCDNFDKIYEEALEEIIKEGFDTDLVASTLNLVEFSIRENKNKANKGIFYILEAFKYWLYDKSPFESLKFEKALENVKKNINKKNYLKNIFEKYFLKNKHKTIIKLIPDNLLKEKITTQIKEKLNKYKKTLNREQLKRLVEETKNLKDSQHSQKDNYNINSLPHLPLKDININVEELETVAIKETKSLALYHNLSTNKIAYLYLYFNAKGLSIEELYYLKIFGHILFNIGTKKTSYLEMENKINKYIGHLNPKFSTIEKFNVFSESYFTIKSKFLIDNYNQFIDIITEIVNEVTFENVKRIKKLLTMEKMRIENSIVNKSYMFLIRKLSAYTTHSGKIKDMVEGCGYYNTILKSIDEIEKSPDKFVSRLKQIKNKLFVKDNFISNIAIDKIYQENVIKIIRIINDSLPERKIIKKDKIFGTIKVNEAFIIPSLLQCNGMGVNIYENGLKYNGLFKLIQNYLRKSYLWKKLRVVGGAYGYFVIFYKDSGFFSIVSLSDPNIKETYDVYKSIYQHIRNFDLNKEELTKLKISSIKEPLLSIERKIEKAFEDYIIGFSYEDKLKLDKEIFECSIKDIINTSLYFKIFSEKSTKCTFGAKEKIIQNKKGFNQIVELL